MEHLHQAVVGLVDHYGYVGVFIAMALGNIGAPIGTELIMPLTGGLVGTGHLSNLAVAIAVAVAAELTGQSAAYAIGRFGGVPIFERWGKYVHFGHEQLQRIHGFFERWGTFAIFVCRFLPVVRGVCGYAAGIAEMNLAHFYLWTFLGSLIFCSGLVVLGYQLGDHLNAILPLIRRGGVLLLAVAILGAAAAALYARRRRGAT
ncbi:MAG TPA: DedA family protein [Verrucomicrobiae bacterium]|nr:DedA family protein [Verrucomicrobiae bacterium]